MAGSRLAGLWLLVPGMLIKRALNASATNTLDAQLDLERDFQRAASLTPDYAEGVRAFLEKRKANFTGRKK